MASSIPQHKRMAMGQKPQGYKTGGLVRPTRDTGLQDTPLEKAKRANGIPGMKKGGHCDCGS